MSKPELTKEIAYNALQNFFNDKPFILFGTGTSCAVDLDFGMKSLEEYLTNAIPSKCDSVQQKKEWEGVLQALSADPDFEQAMNAIKDQHLLKIIIDSTAEHVINVNNRHAIDVLSGKTRWPASDLFKRLVDRLPETDRKLHVATPNYDLMAEYAFTFSGIPYTTGFWGGVIRQCDWLQAERQMTYVERIPKGRSKTDTVTRMKKHIRLYKVHGSLNTFLFNNKLIETDMWHRLQDGVERLMITPGVSKHEKLHDFRDALLTEYDKAVKSHSAFLFLGFGFNDTQLVNNAIKEKLVNQSSPSIIITRDSNQRIDDILKKAKNTWLVCKKPENESTLIKNSGYKNDLHLSDKEIWKFDRFKSEILGG